jgi:hypothetical protein
MDAGWVKDLAEGYASACEQYGRDKSWKSLDRASAEKKPLIAAIDAMQAQIDSLRKEREDMEGLLLWALWHHQGASSPVGRPIRKFLRMEQHQALLVGQAHHAREVVARLSDAALSEESKGTI